MVRIVIWMVVLAAVSFHWCGCTFVLFRPPGANGGGQPPLFIPPPQTQRPINGNGGKCSKNKTMNCTNSTTARPFILPPFPAIPASARPPTVQWVPLGQLIFGNGK